MATWRVGPVDQGRVSVTYISSLGKPDQDCGSTDAATPLTQFVEWVVQEGSPGDLIDIQGTIIQWFRTERQA